METTEMQVPCNTLAWEVAHESVGWQVSVKGPELCTHVKAEQRARCNCTNRVLQRDLEMLQSVWAKAGKQGWEAGKPTAARSDCQRVYSLSSPAVPLNEPHPAR